MTDNHSPKLEQIAVNTIINEIQIITISNIIYLKSDNRKTIINLKNSKEVFASKNIGIYEALLKNNGFFRVHKSYIVNLKYLICINKNQDGHYCVLFNDKIIPISVRKYRLLKERLEY
jgi:two-component system LytT family response regulator